MNRIRVTLQQNIHVRLTVLFTAFMFAQFVILRLANQAGRGFLSDDLQELVYLFIQVAAIAGFLSCALCFSRLKSEKTRRPLTVAAVILCLSGAVVMLFCSPASLFYMIVTGISVLLLGLIGGAVYQRMAVMTAIGSRAGLCIGIGYALAVALQYCLQLQWTVVPALAVLLLFAFVTLTALLLDDGDTQANSERREKQRMKPSALVLSIVITAALLTFTAYYNSYIHHLQIASGYTDYNVYSWPRLLMIPTVILCGVVGDIKGGKLLPVYTLCIAVIALLNTALLGRETYLLNMCLYYIAITSVIAYYHLSFLRLAPLTGRPALWACMGRVIDSAVVILSFVLRFSAQSQVVVLVIDIAALAAVIVMMALSGAFDLSGKVEGEMVTRADLPVDPFPAAQETFRITPSEMKVLRELVLTDDKQEVIASRLSISVSTLRHHVTSIYKKTGVQTRAALCKLIGNM